VVIACPAQAVGPGDHSPFGHFARLFVRGWLPPVIWGSESAFTFGHVEDVAEALILAGEHGRPGECYFIAGHVLGLRAMMKVWGQTTGRRTPFLWLPQSLAVAQAALIAPMLRLLGQPAFISPEVVRSSFVSFRYRSTKAERELGAIFRSADDSWIQTLKAEADRIQRRAAGEG
jgi:dihydroflavonol-4-reductase